MSYPVGPDRREKLIRPVLSFLQSPKSEIMARTKPFLPGVEISTLWGLMSLRRGKEGGREDRQLDECIKKGLITSVTVGNFSLKLRNHEKHPNGPQIIFKQID